MTNFLDQKINTMALEVLSSQGKSQDEIDSAMKRLQFVIDRGINSRSEMIGLLKIAKKVA